MATLPVSKPPYFVEIASVHFILSTTKYVSHIIIAHNAYIVHCNFNVINAAKLSRKIHILYILNWSCFDNIISVLYNVIHMDSCGVYTIAGTRYIFNSQSNTNYMRFSEGKNKLERLHLVFKKWCNCFGWIFAIPFIVVSSHFVHVFEMKLDSFKMSQSSPAFPNWQYRPSVSSYVRWTSEHPVSKWNVVYMVRARHVITEHTLLGLRINIGRWISKSFIALSSSIHDAFCHFLHTPTVNPEYFTMCLRSLFAI